VGNRIRTSMPNSNRPRLVNCIGFDDCPFNRNHKGKVSIVGTVYASHRLDGIIVGDVEKDGLDAAYKIVQLVKHSKFYEHCNLIMLQGICLGGFNVVDVQKVHKELNRPVLVISRKRPDYPAIKRALLTKIPDGTKKWQNIEALGPMEPCMNCYVQRVGIDRNETEKVVRFFCINGNIPEPLRTAHLVAGAIGKGVSKGRV